MGHTYCRILVHVVFSTKNREPTIDPEWRPRLFRYMAGVARDEFGWSLRIGGVADHVHGLLQIKPDQSLSHAMNRWKSLSSGWVNREIKPAADFAWQIGYGGFSVSESIAPKVIQYIDGQEEHHRKQTFMEEFIGLLKRHKIEYDPEKIWD